MRPSVSGGACATPDGTRLRVVELRRARAAPPHAEQRGEHVAHVADEAALAAQRRRSRAACRRVAVPRADGRWIAVASSSCTLVGLAALERRRARARIALGAAISRVLLRDAVVRTRRFGTLAVSTISTTTRWPGARRWRARRLRARGRRNRRRLGRALGARLVARITSPRGGASSSIVSLVSRIACSRALRATEPGGGGGWVRVRGRPGLGSVGRRRVGRGRHRRGGSDPTDQPGREIVDARLRGVPSRRRVRSSSGTSPH